MTPTETLFARILAEIPDASDPFRRTIPTNPNLSVVGFLVWTTWNVDAMTPKKLHTVQILRATNIIDQLVTHDAIIAGLQARLAYLRQVESN
jgi:hypothetical protein